MTERPEGTDRSGAVDELAAGVLDAVPDPALVCDPTGLVRAWNDQFATLVPAVRADGAFRLRELLDVEDDPLGRAVEQGERTRSSGRLGDEPRSVVCRPVERDGVVTAVVVVCERPSSDATRTESAPTEEGRPESNAGDDVDVGESEDELVGAKRRLDLALEATGAGVHEWVIDEDRVYWHETTSRLLGLDPETKVRTPAAFVERVHPEDRERVRREVMEGVENDEYVSVEYRIRRPEGETRWMVTEGEVHSDGDGSDRFVGMVRDVTERKERERELARTNHRLDLALSNTQAGVYEYLVDEDRVVWHDSIVRMFPIDTDRTYALADAVELLIHPEDRERVADAIEGVMAGGEDGDDPTLSVEFRTNEDDSRWVVAEGEFLREKGGSDRIVGTVRDVSERKARERALAEREQRLRAVIESSADPIAMQDTAGRYQVVNEAMLDRAGRERDDLVGATPADVFPGPTAERMERHRREVLETERARVVGETFGDDGDRRVQVTFAPYYGPEGEVSGTVSIARDVTELERQRDELETLTEIQGLVQESVRALAAATTREEIKRTVCERLAASEFYEFVWIGERVPSGRAIEPSCSAGDGDGYLDEITLSVQPEPEGNGPAGEAYRSGDVQVVHDVASDADFEPWREAAVERGFRSVAAVPLTHGSTTHGLLAVYADEPGAFSRRELAGFEALGDVVGFALSAAQYRRLLEAETVLELEYEVYREGSRFIRLSGEHDCTFVIEHAVHTGDQRAVDYVTVEDADPEVFEAVAEEMEAVDSLRRLDGEDGPHFEMTFSDSVFALLADVGARGKRGVIEDGLGHLFVEVPGDADIRQVTEAVERQFGEVDLVAKREQRHAEPPWWHGGGDVGAQLTDRQGSILRAAYYSGYYEWPREADSEELADSLDIASSTFLQHLRKGHRRVLEAMFES